MSDDDFWSQWKEAKKKRAAENRVKQQSRGKVKRYEITFEVTTSKGRETKTADAYGRNVDDAIKDARSVVGGSNQLLMAIVYPPMGKDQ